jgi:predicted dehydrogenase
MTTPIRVGFIGLSSNVSSSLGGAWGRNAHLPYLKQSQKYTIVALCNSSVDSAKKAIEAYGLDASQVRAYGDPTSLANDPDVDMVVCSVKVKEHYTLIKPALEAGKMVFCEWPLASNLAQMKELVDIAEQKNCKTISGLQGRMGEYVPAIQSFIGEGEGRFGKLLSTSLEAYGMIHGMATPASAKYLMEKESGGNLWTITGMHRKWQQLKMTLCGPPTGERCPFPRI